MTRFVRLPLALLLFALVLAGCGLSGDNDENASPDGDDSSAVADPMDRTVRITFGEKWVETSRSELGLDSATLSRLSTDALIDRLSDLAVDGIEPTDATVEFDGTRFAAVGGVGGQEADLAALATAIVDASDDATGAVEVPFSPVEPTIPLARAQEVADELNERVGDGITVSVADQVGALPLSLIGPATEVAVTLDDWSLDLRWDDMADGIAERFPDVGQPGGEATFTVEYDDDGRLVNGNNGNIRKGMTPPADIALPENWKLNPLMEALQPFQDKISILQGINSGFNVYHLGNYQTYGALNAERSNAVLLWCPKAAECSHSCP